MSSELDNVKRNLQVRFLFLLLRGFTLHMTSNMVLSEGLFVNYLYEAASRFERLNGKRALFLYDAGNTYYSWKEVSFSYKNFMHLCGVEGLNKRTAPPQLFEDNKSDAEIFYELCKNKRIKKEYCLTTHGVSTMDEKILNLRNLIDYAKCRTNRLGIHDLLNKYAEFDFAIGDNSAVIGFGRPKKNGRYVTRYPIAISVLVDGIKKFCSKHYKIEYILLADYGEELFSEVLYEIKRETFKTEIENIAPELLETIAKEVLE